MFSWCKSGGYECSTRGDRRFSAFTALMPDGRTIEQWYQCDVKGYDPGGTDWRLGKGNPSLTHYEGDLQWQMYLGLWRRWAAANPELIRELRARAAAFGNRLSDRFATTSINQAHALAIILNEGT